MSAISTSIQLNDRMSPVLASITTAMNMMIGSFGAAQTASETAINTAQWEAAVQQVNSASAAVVQYQEELERVQNKPVNVPEPTWAQTAEPKVFTNTGEDRFASEYQAANQMAQQLYQTQQAISAQAQKMIVTPPGMQNDMASIQNRIQSLSNQVQRLNNIPVNLRTEQTNNQIEAMRGNLGQIVPIQNELNAAISRMDIGAANKAYQQLNSAVNVAERNIRDNVSAQEQFNESVQSGGNAYDGLAGKIGRIAGVLGIGLMVKEAAQMTYESAAQLEATGAKYNTVFSGMTNSADQFISEFQTLTPATVAEARSMASGMQDLLVPMGMQREQATEMTGEYMHLIGALTNFNSATKSAEDVSGAFQSSLSGEYDSLKGLGIQVNETIVKQQAVAMGLASSTDAVSNAAKAQAVLELAYQQSGDALAAYNENALDTTTRMQLLQKGFQDAFGNAGQSALPQINNLLMQVQARMPQINSAIVTFSNVFGGFIQIGTEAFGIIMDIGGAVADNWSWLAPIIGGVTVALVAYNGAMVVYNTVQGISNGLRAIAAARAALNTDMSIAEAAATKTATGAQVGLNAAFLACPITWIVGGIILLIATIYAGVAVFNKFAGTSVSATGIIAGAFGVLAAHIYNSVIYFWNIIAEFINFFYNVWNDPIGAVEVLFYDLASNVIGYVSNMAHAIEDVINKIPGVEVSITAGLDRFQSQLDAAAQNAKSEAEWVEIVKTRDFKDYSQVASDWYNRGAEYESGFMDLFNGSGGEAGAGYNASAQAATDNIALNTGNTAGNTAAMANSMDVLDEDLKYMRDAAEQEVINRFTLAELKVDVKNNNTLTKKTDFDDMGRALSMFTSEFLASAAEGGHI